MSASSPSSLSASSLVLQVLQLHSQVQKQVGRALSAHGIGVSEYLVLQRLREASGQKLGRSELAELVGLSPSGVTRLLNPMEKIGLVAKEDNPRDARMSWVTLTATGQQIAVDAQVSFDHACAATFAHLGAAEVAALLSAIQSAVR